MAVERRPGFAAKEAIICTFRTDLKVVPLCWAMLLCPSIHGEPPFYQGKSWPDSSFLSNVWNLYTVYIVSMCLTYLFVILVIAIGQADSTPWSVDKSQKIRSNSRHVERSRSLLHVPTLSLKSRGLLLSKRCTSAHHNLAFHTNPGSSYSFKQVTMSNS